MENNNLKEEKLEENKLYFLKTFYDTAVGRPALFSFAYGQASLSWQFMTPIQMF